MRQIVNTRFSAVLQEFSQAMRKGEFVLEKEIHNDQDSSFIPDVTFHPTQSIFAVSYRDNDEVRLYDINSQQVIRKYANPQAQLSYPHGALLTENHLIVTNKLGERGIEPSKLTVYRIDSESCEPVTVFTTPANHLREAHSLDIRSGKLLVTYCGKNTGGILTYDFNDDTGEITGPISCLEDWFSGYGEPKGICFSEDGTKVFVTLASKTLPKELEEAACDSSRSASVQNIKSSLRKVVPSILNKDQKSTQGNHHFNGLVEFDIDSTGTLSKEPARILPQPNSRLENIHIVRGLCVVADPINDSVYLYNMQDDAVFEKPAQVLTDTLSFPHSASISPDRSQLVVTNYGIERKPNGYPAWSKFRTPRNDKLTIYKALL